MIITRHYITRQYVRDHPEWIFLFGDNLVHEGYGGQAKEMRGEPNAVGIPTKKYPDNRSESFFTDNEYEANCRAIYEAFYKIPKGTTVVIPSAGLGTGLARLDTMAPKTFKYLDYKIRQLMESDR